MKRRIKAIFALLTTTTIIAVCAIAYYTNEVFSIQNAINQLNLITQNPDLHSGMAGVLLAHLEPKLQEAKATLFLLCLTAFISDAALLILWKKPKTHIKNLALLVIIILTFMLLTTTTPNVGGETLIHLYARVEMTVPPNSGLFYLSGTETALNAKTSTYWVCYHIGIAFPASNEWIAAGWLADAEKGNIFYTESQVNGGFEETDGQEVTLNTPFQIQLCISTGGDVGCLSTNAWYIEILLNGQTVMWKSRPFPSNAAILCVAGGESICSYNHMSTSFMSLQYIFADAYGMRNGFWTGNVFPCVTVQDPPYQVSMQTPYYSFTVFGFDNPSPQQGLGLGGGTTPYNE